MPVLKHKKPCKVCPFRRTSASGWLGASTPQEFIEQTLSEVDMPCHAAINYEDPDWQVTQYPDAPRCAGSLVFLNNTCKMPRDRQLNEDRKKTQGDHATVFSHPMQFLDHHSKG